MQTPGKGSPLEAVPQNGGAPVPTTAGKSECHFSELNLPMLRPNPSLLFGHLGGRGRRQLMVLARLAAELDPKIVPVIEDWDRMKPPLQNAVDLDALCRAHDVELDHLVVVVGVAELRFHGDPSILAALFNEVWSFIHSADAGTE